ncbi:MAG TPA: hypothetical protein VIL98_04910 [Gaiellaceae bacterium]
MIGYTRPLWPLFLHILGAMTLVGAVLTVAIVSLAGWQRSEAQVLARTAFRTLAAVGIPAYVVMRIFAEVLRSDEGYTHALPTWISLGQAIADGGLLVLIVTTGVAFWWQRSGKIAAGRTLAVLSTVYLVLLGVAWFAMSAKWG